MHMLLRSDTSQDIVKLDLIKNIRYIGGISGGSWAAAVFTYAQNRSLDDLHFLGDVVFPNDMTIQSLKSMESDCARSFVNRDMMRIALSALHNGEVKQIQ